MSVRCRLAVAPWVGLLGFVLAGCAEQSPPTDLSPPTASPDPAVEDPDAADPSQTGESGGPAGTSPDDAVTVRVVDESEFAQVLEQHRGKVVLVDYWATWCLNCLELLPHTVELSNQLADRGLVVLTLSMDDPDDETAVLDQLRARGASMDNFISKYGGSDKSAEAFGLEDLALPKYQLFDRSGGLHATLTTPIEPEDIDLAVEALLGGP